MVEQLALWEEVPKKEYYRIVTKRLKDYPHLKKATEIKPLHEDTAKLEIKRKKVELIESALEQLDPEEHHLIKVSYFVKYKPKDISIMMDLGMAKTCFYKTKDEAIRKIATVMNLI